MNRTYGGYIWTDHVFDRMRQRGVSQRKVYETIHHPDVSTEGSDPRSLKYQKFFGDELVEAIVKRDEGKIIVVSCWAKESRRFSERVPLWERGLRWIWNKLRSNKV